MRKADAAMRRQEREAVKRQKALERMRKEAAKLNALQQAQLEVDSYENQLEVLLSIHKECRLPMDWRKMAYSLQPFARGRRSGSEIKAVFCQSLSPESGASNEVEMAIAEDDREYALANQQFSDEVVQWKELRELARRVLSGDLDAYAEAVTQFSPFSEIDQLGSAIAFLPHSSSLVEARLTVNGQEVIPKEVKSLTAAGKLTAKAMPKAKFHEIYQDYVCGAILRLTRELFALLPVQSVLATASVADIDSATGLPAELPILSVSFERAQFEALNFASLDPSDSMENFFHRGDVLASRKTGRFAAIAPIATAELDGGSSATSEGSLDSILPRLAELRRVIASASKKIFVP